MPSHAATLELKTEKANAHNGNVLSVDFDKDGGKIVSGGEDGTIKVWDLANPRPYNASEWEEVEGDGEEEYDDEAEMEYPFWRNNVTGDVQEEEPSGAGELSM